MKEKKRKKKKVKNLKKIYKKIDLKFLKNINK